MLRASDDEGVTWTALGTDPLQITDSGAAWDVFLVIQKACELSDGLGPDGSGTMLATRSFAYRALIVD